jgi:hypothetical protein
MPVATGKFLLDQYLLKSSQTSGNRLIKYSQAAIETHNRSKKADQ